MHRRTAGPVNLIRSVAHDGTAGMGCNGRWSTPYTETAVTELFDLIERGMGAIGR